MALSPDSRLHRAAAITVVDDAGEVVSPPFVDVVPYFKDTTRRSNRVYRINDTDDWHRMSHRFYGRGMDFWVLLEFNDVIDPFTELVVGRRIIVPSNDTVQFDVKDFGTAADVEEQAE